MNLIPFCCLLIIDFELKLYYEITRGYTTEWQLVKCEHLVLKSTFLSLWSQYVYTVGSRTTDGQILMDMMFALCIWPLPWGSAEQQQSRSVHKTEKQFLFMRPTAKN